MVDTTTAPPTTDTRPWGFHAIMDCANCNSAKITDLSNISAWLVDVLQKTNLTSVGTATVVATDAGYTAVQILTTGTITAQFVDVHNQVYIDVFSNTEYNPVELETSIKTFFDVIDTDIKKILIPRNATV
jgi:S-adenosylmethionine/arginine decarboxylase-like enzyme